MARYIDAEALENRIKAEWAKREDDKGYGLAQFFVKTQPTADVAPVVHAHWITKKLNVGKGAKCSNCGHTFYFYRGHLQIDRLTFCPDCGAKMDEEKT